MKITSVQWYKSRCGGQMNIFTHDRLTWHGEVFEGHGTELGGEGTHPVGVGIADPRRSGLHVSRSATPAPLRKPLSGAAGAIPVTDSRALPTRKNYHGSSCNLTVNLQIPPVQNALRS